MWISLSNEELKLLQQGLDLLAEKTEGELETNKAKLWAKIQRRMENDKRMQKEKEKLDKIFQEKLDKIFQEKTKELKDENKR
jgi:hypothetical protein